MLGGDTAFDLVAALATCATGDGYCGQAQSDIARKDAAAAKVPSGIRNGDAWDEIKSTLAKAFSGDQKALENVAGILTGVVISAKVLLVGGNGGSKTELAPVSSISGKAASGTENAVNTPKLNSQLAAQEIANGHAFVLISMFCKGGSLIR